MYYNNNNFGCGCHPTPPPPPIPCYHDYYGHDCYHEHRGFPHPGPLPANGPFNGSLFVLNNYNPYLVDSTNVNYGEIINVGENVRTYVTQRPDQSCVNIAATFDMLKAINKNVVMEEYLEKCIGQNASKYENALPMIKATLTFRLHYSIIDNLGGYVDSRIVDVSTNDVRLHYTDIRDFFLETAKGIFADNIPAYDYSGIYRLQIERVEVWVGTLDLPTKCADGYNPYYQWADNNQRIVLQHDTIDAATQDDTILLASVDVNQSIPFQANITTRLRLSFTAFIGDMIVVNQAYGIWNAIYEPSEERMKNLEDKVDTLQSTVDTLTAELNALKNTVNALVSENQSQDARIAQNELDIARIKAEIPDKYNTLSTRITNLETRVEILENRPIALHGYRAGDDYVTSQLTWNKIGELYQVTKNFTSTGNFNDEISNGNIVPLNIDGNVELEALTEALNTLESAVNVISGRVDTINTTLGEYDTRITDAEEMGFYDSQTEFPESGVDNKVYFDKSTNKFYRWNSTNNEYEEIQ